MGWPTGSMKNKQILKWGIWSNSNERKKCTFAVCAIIYLWIRCYRGGVTAQTTVVYPHSINHLNWYFQSEISKKLASEIFLFFRTIDLTARLIGIRINSCGMEILETFKERPQWNGQLLNYNLCLVGCWFCQQFSKERINKRRWKFGNAWRWRKEKSDNESFSF